MNNPYKVSVITAVLNGADTLPQTIRSVACQDYRHVEYIVVDGGSSDGTLALLERHGDVVDRWVSGPDSGIGEAMNKGLALASGDLLLFLHADDRLADCQALSRIMSLVLDLNHVWACEVRFGAGPGQGRLRPRPFNAWAHLRNPLPHQGVLFPRALLKRLGGFDTDLRISMDYDLWLRVMAAGVPLARLDETISVMGAEGISSRLDWPGLRARFSEERAVQLRHAPSAWWRLLYRLFWPAYLGYRRLGALLERGR